MRPVDDDAAAHAGAHRDHHERAGDEVEVVVMGLGECRHGRVVVDEGRDPYPVGQQLTQRHALQRDVDRAARAACFEVDHARHADADGVGRAGVLDRLGQLLDERLAVGQAVGRRTGSESTPSSRTATETLVPPTSTPIKRSPTLCTLATLYGPPVADDHALVERLRAGDEEAFMDLVVRWSPSMMRVARMYVPTAAVADDVVQETWLAVLQGSTASRSAPRCARGSSASSSTAPARAASASVARCRSRRSPARRPTATSRRRSRALRRLGDRRGRMGVAAVRWWEEPERALASDEAVERIESEIAKLPRCSGS
jgi:RNA polymerase sigma-70 factor (ECF subfamily)